MRAAARVRRAVLCTVYRVLCTMTELCLLCAPRPVRTELCSKWRPHPATARHPTFTHSCTVLASGDSSTLPLATRLEVSRDRSSLASVPVLTHTHTLIACSLQSCPIVGVQAANYDVIVTVSAGSITDVDRSAVVSDTTSSIHL